MITDSDRQMLIPSLDEVLAALKRVPPPASYAPQFTQAPIYEDTRDDVLPVAGDFPNAALNTPVTQLQQMRVVKNRDVSTVWRVVKMPEFHL